MLPAMKTSIDLPDELYRRVKAKSAMERRTVREVATSLLTEWVGESAIDPASAAPDAGAAWLYSWRELGRRVADAEPVGDPKVDVPSVVDQLVVDRR